MKKGISIKTQAAMTTVFFMGILTVAVAVIGYKLYYDSVMESFTTYAETVLEYAYRAAVRYSFGDMIADRDMPENYEILRSELNQIKDCSDIEYLYAIYFEDIDDLHSLHYAINAKTQEELSTGQPLEEIYTYMGKPCEEGGFADDTLKLLQQAVKGRTRENGTLTGYSDVYGHMLNGYRVIYDSEDNAAGLICVEIDINRINTDVDHYVRIVVLIAVLLTAFVIAVYLFNMQRHLIGPIVSIARNSESFVKKMESHAEPEKLVYENVRTDTGGELRLLADNVERLAVGVASYMSNLKVATAEKERIGTELSLATKIQASMLPNIYPPFPDRPEFDIYATMTPAKEVGGDFYDFFLVDSDHLCMVMADVSGKGVPAALFMMASKIILANNGMLGKSPARILEDTNATICANNHEQMFVTVWLGILEISTGKLTAANAGHEYPVICMPDGRFELLKDKHGFVIGGMDGMKYKEYEVQLSPGAKLFVYTDGVPEATNKDNELFGTERMLAALNENTGVSPETVLQNVRAAVDDFVKNAEQFDDLTMLCMEYKGGEASLKAYELDIMAENEILSEVQSFLGQCLAKVDCPAKAQMQLELAAEEIFVNIANYAYAPEKGRALVRVEVSDDPVTVTLTFIDQGKPYDPLKRKEPDVTLPAEEREIGGLGIFLTKKTMDDVFYEYRDGQNILTLKKKI